MAAMPRCRRSRKSRFRTLAAFRNRGRRCLIAFFGALALITQVVAWQLPMPGRFLPLPATADPAVHHDHGAGHSGAPGSGEGSHHPAHDHESCPICLTLQLVGSTILPPATSAPVPVIAGIPAFHSATDARFVSRTRTGSYARAPPLVG
jgi:hypothetical protein